MRRKVVHIMLVLIIAFIMAGCSSIKDNNSNKASQNINSNTSSDNADIKNTTNTYINSKYAFRISYPAEWGDFMESQNGDGAILYNKEENDIRFYAAESENGYETKLKNQVKNSGGTYQRFTFESGNKGMMFRDIFQNKQRIRVVIEKNGIQYSFYALVTDKFLKENEEKLNNVAKSMVVLEK